MTLNDIYLLSQIAAAIAVAASLVFVGMQMYQNTKAVRASTSQAHSTNYHAIISSLIDTEEFPEIWHKGSMAPQKLSEVERIRFTAWLSGLFRFYESSRVQWLNGNLDKEHWHTIEQQVISIVGFPGVKYWWSLRRQWHSPEFIAWVEALQPGPTEDFYGQYLAKEYG